MSGTASRFQQRFGYGPGLRVGTYPGQAPSVLPPTQPGVAFPQMPAVQPPPAAPTQPAQPDPAPPVSAGAVMMDPDTSASGPDGDGHNSAADLGDHPGDLSGLADAFGFGSIGSGIGTQFGHSNWGELGSALGGLAGMAGVPGAGFAGSIGTIADVSALNGQLSSLGLAPDISYGQALGSNMSFGLAGRSADQQFGDLLGFEAFAEAPLSAFNTPDIPDAIGADAPPTATEQNAQDQGMGGFGFGGDFGAMSAAGRGEAVGADVGSAGYGGTATGGMDYGGADKGGSEQGGDKGDTGADGNSDGGASGGNGGAGAGDADSAGAGTYMLGGYTGAGADGAVQPAQQAGTVHEGEHVTNAQATEYYGPDLLAFINEMRIPRSKLAALAGINEG